MNKNRIIAGIENKPNVENSFQFLQEDADCQLLVDELIKQFKHTPTTFDAFMLCARRALLSAIVFYLYREIQPSDQNFTSVMKLLKTAEYEKDDDNYYPCTVLDIIIEGWAKNDPEHIGLKRYDVFKQATPEMANTIIQNIQENMNCLGWN